VEKQESWLGHGCLACIHAIFNPFHAYPCDVIKLRCRCRFVASLLCLVQSVLHRIVMVQGRLHCIVLGGGLVQGRLGGNGEYTFDASNRVTRFK
jgi:hypothetical protein